MKSSDIFWRIVGIFVSLITMAVPVYVTYDTLDKGKENIPITIPEKKVVIDQYGRFNALHDLYAMEDSTRFSLTINDENVDNLFIFETTLKNVGKSPIVPDDFIEPLSVTVEKPWKILSVSNNLSTDLKMSWIRINDNKYKAKPVLINPGDYISVNIYLTNTETSEIISIPKKEIEKMIKWDARIVNLRSFSKIDYKSIFSSDEKNESPIKINVVHSGWSVIFILICIPLFLILYLHLLQKAGFLISWDSGSYILIFISCILSIAASDGIATYLFDNYSDVYHWYNVPPIIIHSICLVYLWIKAKNNKTSA